MEVRAFGLMLEDIAEYLEPAGGAAWAGHVAYLRRLAAAAANPHAPTQRPTFSTMARALAELREGGPRRAGSVLGLDIDRI